MPNSPPRHHSGITDSVAMKRESSLESEVSESRTRVTKKLRVTVPKASTRVARVYISRHDIRSESKHVSSGSVSTSQSRASRGEGRVQSSHVSPSHARPESSSSPASDEAVLSGDEADDEIDTQSERSRSSSRASCRPPDMDNDSDAMTEVDEDEDETRHVEMSIVQYDLPSSPPSSLPATPTSFPSLRSFPRFGATLATIPGLPASHLELEDVLLTPRQGAPWVNISSSENSGDDREIGISGLQKKRKRKAAAFREDSVSGIEEAMPLVSTSSSSEETVARRLFHGPIRRMGKSLVATVSGVTAGLQALPPLNRNRTLLESGSDIEMGFLQGSQDVVGSETDTDMKDVEIHAQLALESSAYSDVEPFMTLDQFTAYRSNRIALLNNPRLRHHELVDKSTLRGQNIQIYLAKLGYTLPIPLGRAVARHKRCLGKPLPRQYKPITRLTGNLREDLLIRLFSKYRRDVIKGYNKFMSISMEQAAQILAIWQGIHLANVYDQQQTHGHDSSAVDPAVSSAEAVPDVAEETSSPADNIVPVISSSTVVAVKAFARTYADRLEPYEAIYPEAAARYTRALLSMINDRFPAWDRWWSDERRYALHRSQWGLYDAETARIEREAREVQDTLARRRHARARNERMERLGFGGAALREGMETRMDRDEAELIERTVLEARIQQFRTLVNASPVAGMRPASIVDAQYQVSQQVAVVPASPPPSYNGSPPASPTTRSAWSTPRAIVSVARNLITHVPESPPQLPSYQPNTYRRGVSPPPPPPFNARTDAIPVSRLSYAFEHATADSSVGRSAENTSDNVRLPGAYSREHRAERLPRQSATLRLFSQTTTASVPTLAETAPTARVVEVLADDVEEDDGDEEEVEELDDLLEEVAEEDVEEQELGDRGRERVRSGCLLM